MSRCFPYPPPGYTPSRASKEALIESIKLQKEQEKAKAQKRKERRREKEDESKGRKDKRNGLRKEINEKPDLNSRKRRKGEEGREERKRRRKENNEKPDLNSNKFDCANGLIGEKICANKEQVEGSGLTEEHDQPIRLHLPSTSSESTENNSKRKRPSSPVKVIRGHGTIIRIQLASKKKNLSDALTNEQHCSTSGRTDIASLSNRRPNFCASIETGDFVQGDLNRIVEKQSTSTSGKAQPAAPSKTGIPPRLDAIEGSKKNSKSIQYQNLFENWVPPSLHDAPSSPEDLDWLICSKHRPERRQKIDNDSLFCSSSSSLLQPRAQLLPGMEMYALPFTVPY
ncbi:DNA ligase 1-like [Dorcoceras hygrometricum]|uniref:DNA ligase 1-like n=1 Tax=Dorcoceras hygrometricum TaxID=472368 RepID=A0A2Z7AET4_9LAMI|nr:DNA ligase 1-like [Dorcoceras hygrometricum]